MRRLLWAFVMTFLVGFSVMGLYGQAVQYRSAESYMPETLTIKRELPDRTRVCVEPPDGGLMACRTLGDLRDWVFKSKAK